MPAILKILVKVVVGVYEFVDELRVEARVNRELEARIAESHRIQAERYIEASHRAGHEEPSPKKVLH